MAVNLATGTFGQRRQLALEAKVDEWEIIWYFFISFFPSSLTPSHHMSAIVPTCPTEFDRIPLRPKIWLSFWLSKTQIWLSILRAHRPACHLDRGRRWRLTRSDSKTIGRNVCCYKNGALRQVTLTETMTVLSVTGARSRRTKSMEHRDAPILTTRLNRRFIESIKCVIRNCVWYNYKIILSEI